MRMRILKTVLLVGALFALAQAQAIRPPKPQAKPARPAKKDEAEMHEPGFGFIRTEFRFGGKVVKHAPYAAEAITESTQVLANGTKLSQKTTALVYRDGEGRTRREQSDAPVGPFATPGTKRRVIFISDPVAGVAYTLYPDTRTGEKTSLPPAEVIDAANPAAAPPPPPAGERQPPPPGFAERRPPPPAGERQPPPPRPNDQGQLVSLGKRVMEGMPSDGERTTIIIPAGSIGNDQPLEIVEERWKSPDLRTTLWSKTSDPRWGETIYQLTKIVRGEPDKALFVVPGDYVLNDAPAKGGKRKGERGIR